MRIRLLIVLLSLSLFSGSAFSVTISGVLLLPTFKAGEQPLKLNGAGVRKKLFIKLYVAALYLQDKTHHSDTILDDDAPMAIRLSIVSSLINSKRMEKATREGFESSTHGNTQALSAEIEQFIDVFRKPIAEGDTYDLVYTPAKGTRIYKNEHMISSIKGILFKKALFGIWISDRPVQNSLKNAMLGK
jgi:hypothetical protein